MRSMTAKLDTNGPNARAMRAEMVREIRVSLRKKIEQRHGEGYFTDNFLSAADLLDALRELETDLRCED